MTVTMSPPASSIVRLPLDALRVDSELMPRDRLDLDHIADIAEAVSADPDSLPPVVAFEDDDGTRWLAGGFHRYAGHALVAAGTIAVSLRHGSRADAMFFAAAENATTTALKRSHADRRKSVILAILSGRELTPQELASHCQVGINLARQMYARRAEILQSARPAPDATATATTGAGTAATEPGNPAPPADLQARIDEARKTGGAPAVAALLAGEEQRALAERDRIEAAKQAAQRRAWISALRTRLGSAHRLVRKLELGREFATPLCRLLALANDLD